MMADKELADELLQVLGWHPDIRKQPGYRGDGQFVTDARVAIAILEKVADEGFLVSVYSAYTGEEYSCTVDHIENVMRSYSASNASLSRAINEAGAETLR